MKAGWSSGLSQAGPKISFGFASLPQPQGKPREVFGGFTEVWLDGEGLAIRILGLTWEPVAFLADSKVISGPGELWIGAKGLFEVLGSVNTVTTLGFRNPIVVGLLGFGVDLV